MDKRKPEPIPIVFIHKGYSEYFSYSLAQARIQNPLSPIFILGDEKTNRPGYATFVNINKYRNAVVEFGKNYKNLSFNDDNIEKFCFERWFYLMELMNEYKLDFVFTCDSDVMLYTNISNNCFLSKNFDFACCIPKDQGNYKLCASAHVSYWTLETIKQFCLFILTIYSKTEMPKEILETWNRISSGSKLGGISDMTMLQLFSREKQTLLLNNVVGGETFDNNINTSENFYPNEYVMVNLIKKINWRHGLPYGINQLENEEVKFNALHCQGASKVLLDDFFKLTNGYVKAQMVKWSYKIGRILRKF